MAQDKDNRAHNQPSHETQGKGGQQSGSQHSQDKGGGQHQQESGNRGQQAGHNAPSHESQGKGGQQSHSGKNS